MSSGDFSAFLSSLPESSRYAAEERAAIMEFDGGMERGAAERAVMAEWREGIAVNSKAEAQA